MSVSTKDIERQLLERGSFASLNPMQKAVVESKSRKIILLSPTGSGKTAAFSAFLLRHSGAPKPGCHALIIAPARELARQINEVLKKLMPGYRIGVLTGGHSLRQEVNVLGGSDPDIVIATPGRLLDHLQRGTFNPAEVETAVIDEMDKCLDLGFLPDIKKILRQLPSLRNIMLTSATMPSDTELLKLIGNATLIDFSNSAEVDSPDIEVIEIPSYEKDKTDTAASLLNTFNPDKKTIVFVNHRESAERLYNSLKRKGFAATLYHGALEQDDREQAVAGLRGGAFPIMVATDLAARGLDIPEVENVVHYHLPVSEEAYIHRNGRTARAGASGKVYIITHDDEEAPTYARVDRKWQPDGSREKAETKPGLKMIVLNVGKRDKISKGDILGFLTKQAGLSGQSIGRIEVGNDYSVAVVAADEAGRINSIDPAVKIKNKRFKAWVKD